MRVIYSLGHSKHPINQFLRLIQHRNVQLLCDVRTHPRSQWTPWFNGPRLEQALEQAGIGYVWRPELGGLEPRPPAIILETLTGLFRDPRTMALMCSEGDFRKCHRHYLLAPLIASLGCQVQQITPTGALVADPGPRQQHHDAVPDDAQGFLQYTSGKGELDGGLQAEV
jgi:uncharacterized protein (DUF488 family)